MLIILFGLGLGAWGVVNILKPELSWKLFERWKSYRADEPSGLYLLFGRIGGALLALTAAVLIGLAVYDMVTPDVPQEPWNPEDITIKAYDSAGREIKVYEELPSGGEE